MRAQDTPQVPGREGDDENNLHALGGAACATVNRGSE